MQLIKKVKINNKIVIKILGFIKISYTLPKAEDKFVKITNYGINNLINNKQIGNYHIVGTGEIIIAGKNNKIEIDENVTFNNCHIEFLGDNIKLKIGKNCTFNNVYFIFNGCETGNEIEFCDNFINVNNLQVFAGGGVNKNLKIGKNCMCSRFVTIYTQDGHNIYDKNSNKIINTPKNSVIIGDNVWIGHGVSILKNTSLPNNTIVGIASVVNKKFEEESTAIAGNPAKIVKRNVYFER